MPENHQQKDFSNCDDNLNGTYTISSDGTKVSSQQQTLTTAATNGSRFVNVDKFLRYVLVSTYIHAYVCTTFICGKNNITMFQYRLSECL